MVFNALGLSFAFLAIDFKILTANSLSNSLKNPYTPNNHWGYDWAGNSSSPTTEGVSYYHDPVRDTFRVRTLCDGKVIENTIEK